MSSDSPRCTANLFDTSVFDLVNNIEPFPYIFDVIFMLFILLLFFCSSEWYITGFHGQQENNEVVNQVFTNIPDSKEDDIDFILIKYNTRQCLSAMLILITRPIRT